MKKMRRIDREVCGRAEIEAILRGCEVCRLGFCAGNIPYIVPMNFGYEFSGGVLFLYFHCAGEGRKLDFLAQNSVVCFELDHPIAFLPGDIPSRATYTYECVMGEGEASVVQDDGEKRRALNLLMEHYTGAPAHDFTGKCAAGVTVLKVEAHSFSAKRGFK